MVFAKQVSGKHIVELLNDQIGYLENKVKIAMGVKSSDNHRKRTSGDGSVVNETNNNTGEKMDRAHLSETQNRDTGASDEPRKAYKAAGKATQGEQRTYVVETDTETASRQLMVLARTDWEALQDTVQHRRSDQIRLRQEITSFRQQVISQLQPRVQHVREIELAGPDKTRNIRQTN